MSKWVISCKEYAFLASKSMEKSMSMRERLLIKIHLWLCPPCNHVKKHLQLISKACRLVKGEEFGEESETPKLPKERCEQIQAAIEEQSRRGIDSSME